MLAAVLSLAACSCSADTSDPTPEPEPEAPVSRGAYKHVVILGVDGGGAFFDNATAPNVTGIFSNGAVSYNTRTSTPSISAQCWGSMLHGVTPEFHRLSNEIVSRKRYDPESPYPSVFRLLHEARPDAALASFCNWDPINYGIIENNLGVTMGTGNDSEVTDLVLNYIEKTFPDLLFVQFDSVDGAGHGNGYGTAKHKAALTVVDSYIKKIYDALVKTGLMDETLFIVTADHGGTPQGSHGGDTDAEMNVFLGVLGSTVEKGGVILQSEVRDIAAIAAYALGLNFPEYWTGRVPSGLFPGVEAKERKTVDIPISDVRKHSTVPTPDISVIWKLLKNHKTVAYLPFDDNIKDSFGNTVTEKNGKLYFYDAYFSHGVAIYDGFVKMKDVSFGKNSFSVAFWIKTDTVKDDPSIISNKDWANGYNDGFVISLRPSDIKFNVGCKSSGVRMDATAALPVDYDKGWMHVAVVVDRKNDAVRFYYDFKFEDEVGIPSALSDLSFDALDLNIGQDGTGKYGYVLPAQLDEMIITADVLTDADIAALKDFYR